MSVMALGVDDEPAHRRRGVLHQGAHLVGEAVGVGVEEIRTEAIDDQPGFGLDARRGGHRHRDARPHPVASTVVWGR